MDRKTAAKAPSDKGLEHDDQLTAYCYGHWRLTGDVPRGAMYDVLIKQVPQAPRLIKGNSKNHPHNEEGEALSTAKDQLTTPDLYREALRDFGIMEKGGYISTEGHADCLASLLAHGWDRFFRRMETTRNLEMLLQFERRLFVEYDQMMDAKDNLDLCYPNPSTRLCGFCPVAPICLAMEDGSDWEDVMEERYEQGLDRKAEGAAIA